MPLAQLSSDRYFVCPTQRLSREFALSGASVYMYYFSIAISGYEIGAHRGSILPLVFGTWNVHPGRDLTAYERAASEAIVYYFKNFMSSGDPNVLAVGAPNTSGVKFPSWPPLKVSNNDHGRQVSIQELLFTRHGTFVGGNTEAGSRDCAVWDNMSCIWQTERIALSRPAPPGYKGPKANGGGAATGDRDGSSEHNNGDLQAPVSFPHRFAGNGTHVDSGGISTVGIFILFLAMAAAGGLLFMLQKRRRDQSPHRGYEQVESMELPPLAYMKR